METNNQQNKMPGQQKNTRKYWKIINGNMKNNAPKGKKRKKVLGSKALMSCTQILI